MLGYKSQNFFEGIKINMPYLQLEKIRIPRNLKIRFKYSAPPPVRNYNPKKKKLPPTQRVLRPVFEEGPPEGADTEKPARYPKIIKNEKMAKTNKKTRANFGEVRLSEEWYSNLFRSLLWYINLYPFFELLARDDPS
jgi:hypothetical protein